MTDRNGNELNIGDRCIYLGDSHKPKNQRDPDDAEYVGRYLTVRKFGERRGVEQCRADDGKADADIPDNDYEWSAWLDGKSVAKA